MIFVFISSFKSSANMTSDDYIEQSANIVKKLYDYGLDEESIINTATNERTRVLIFNSFLEIDEQYRNQINILNKNRIEANKEVIIHQDDTFIIFKLDSKYCIIYPLLNNGVFTIQMAIIVAGIITICLAIFTIFMGIGTFMKPLINMSIAARKIAKGDYDAFIEVRQNKDAIGQLVDDFNYMSKKLYQTEMLRNDFISNISHEFKTPIQSIYGFANLLYDEEKNDIHKEYLKSICEEAERLSSLSSNILQLNRLDNMVNIGEYSIYDFDEQIRQSILMLESKWTEKNLLFNIELDPIKINAQKDMMKQVIINLLDNAIKFTPDNGTIDIILYKDRENVVVVVHDSGKGIMEDEMERIFEKFYKGDKSRNSSGNGLGLSLVKKILDMHGFTINVKNAVTGGAEFTIVIPLS